MRVLSQVLSLLNVEKDLSAVAVDVAAQRCDAEELHGLREDLPGFFWEHSHPHPHILDCRPDHLKLMDESGLFQVISECLGQLLDFLVNNRPAVA